ncbi:hypothetical protein ACLGL1_01300 [Peptococcus simiae]|uniref:hypothetical protein n=1 Tax=Peptococcus simiae TaxID=1643805 RepID=UPI003980F80B
MKIKQYDKVLLRDGRTAQIVEVFNVDGKIFFLGDIDIPLSDGSLEWETDDIPAEEIVKVIK